MNNFVYCSVSLVLSLHISFYYRCHVTFVVNSCCLLFFLNNYPSKVAKIEPRVSLAKGMYNFTLLPLPSIFGLSLPFHERSATCIVQYVCRACYRSMFSTCLFVCIAYTYTCTIFTHERTMQYTYTICARLQCTFRILLDSYLSSKAVFKLLDI